jgi:hypothetical protein
MKLLKHLSPCQRLHEQIERLSSELKKWRTWKPPGHFYSPIPSLEEVKAHEDKIFGEDANALHAINLDESRQSDLMEAFALHYRGIPFPEIATPGFRYFYRNEYFSYADAVTLYCMLRHVKPRRVVEVGSGFSSALMLDTNEKFLKRRIEFTFIEPHPERLESLILEGDNTSARILRQQVQETPVSLFQELQQGDILFIDSSHVGKTGSDVNYLLFEVL